MGNSQPTRLQTVDNSEQTRDEFLSTLDDDGLRESLGKRVRSLWVAWAEQQPHPKASWLVPWDGLTEPEKEVDRLIGGGIWTDCLREHSKILDAVDHLPKINELDKDGKVTQTCPVYPGMTVWLVLSDGGPCRTHIQAAREDSFLDGAGLECDYSEAFNTREAAEAGR